MVQPFVELKLVICGIWLRFKFSPTWRIVGEKIKACRVFKLIGNSQRFRDQLAQGAQWKEE